MYELPMLSSNIITRTSQTTLSSTDKVGLQVIDKAPETIQVIYQAKLSTNIQHLTHWGRDKMAAISQMTFSNAFSWMKRFEFLFKFHWNLFPRVQGPINNKSALVQIMAWRRSGDKPLYEPMLVYHTDAYMHHSASMLQNDALTVFTKTPHTLHTLNFEPTCISVTFPRRPLPPSWSSHCQSTPRTTRAPGKIPRDVIFLLLRRGSTNTLRDMHKFITLRKISIWSVSIYSVVPL